ncbi:hypothetical protein MKW98_021963 [Papaver atlanticum]|uniref:Uncharacterized protein n=1 Tax=Papaver atlanticum TaxID=357466 RepID=A0AAD4Y0D1_9MAGN|nr:hypothetical protein MKW98_021963 [Papaver atlanticum]
MAMRNFYNGIKGLKVKELPAHLKPIFTVDHVKKTNAVILLMPENMLLLTDFPSFLIFFSSSIQVVDLFRSRKKAFCLGIFC